MNSPRTKIFRSPMVLSVLWAGFQLMKWFLDCPTPTLVLVWRVLSSRVGLSLSCDRRKLEFVKTLLFYLGNLFPFALFRPPDFVG